jgi:hypothetical protein
MRVRHLPLLLWVTWAAALPGQERSAASLLKDISGAGNFCDPEFHNGPIVEDLIRLGSETVATVAPMIESVEAVPPSLVSQQHWLLVAYGGAAGAAAIPKLAELLTQPGMEARFPRYWIGIALAHAKGVTAYVDSSQKLRGPCGTWPSVVVSRLISSLLRRDTDLGLYQLAPELRSDWGWLLWNLPRDPVRRKDGTPGAVSYRIERDASWAAPEEPAVPFGKVSGITFDEVPVDVGVTFQNREGRVCGDLRVAIRLNVGLKRPQIWRFEIASLELPKFVELVTRCALE